MVYVDDMYRHPMGKYRNMKMSHMVADTTEELLDMARKIGVQVKWIQCKGLPREHFDICASKRSLAIKYGAVSVTMQYLANLDRDPSTGRLVNRVVSPGKG